MDFELEICVNSIHSALAAQQGGASRVELCDNMAEGGTTPSAGMIAACKSRLSIPVFPIIRPRGGDFVYSDEEFEVMMTDIAYAKAAGCEGVVLGILKADGNIDKVRCGNLIAMARPMAVTFHRAFDRCHDLSKGLEDVISLGCERLLTSGGELTAEGGIQRLKLLIEQAAGRMGIMAGSGVTGQNITRLAGATGARQFHSTAKAEAAMTYSGTGSLANADRELPVMETSSEKVQTMKVALMQYFNSAI